MRSFEMITTCSLAITRERLALNDLRETPLSLNLTQYDINRRVDDLLTGSDVFNK